jgi:peptidoglycan glycosyltransferase
MASHSPATVAKAYASYYTAYANNGNAPGAALVDQATDHTWAPGSTMKVITTAAIFDHDPSLADMVWPIESSTKLPLTSLLLHNFGGESCGGTLIHILTVSCDTAYALIGVSLGPKNLAEEANAFGYNKVPPIDLWNVYGAPDAVAPSFPPPADIPGSLAAYSAIGQYGNQESALGNALVAAGIANNGVIMSPHVMSRVVNYAGETVSTYQPHQWLRATSSDTANQVRTDMLSVAESGTAAGIFPAADHVAAKTGTAETSGGCTANWLIAMAPAGPGDTPRVAVAAVIPAQAGVACGSESVTGATVAGPAVGQLLTAALAVTK